MFKPNRFSKTVVVLVLALIFAGSGTAAWARDHHDNYGHHHDAYRYHRHHYAPSSFFGRVVFELSNGFIALTVGGEPYYYCDGVFYKKHASRFVMVAPPVGLVLVTRPAEAQAVTINGITYYVSNGVYYLPTPQGYQIVAPPVAGQQVVAVSPAVGTAEIFTVNIPNDRGGYTAVAIKRTKKGFTGPQGEFYSEFPTVAQLKVMYGK